MANESEVGSDSEEIIIFNELEDAYEELEKDFKKLKKVTLVLRRSMHVVTLKLMELLKIKYEYVAKLDFHKKLKKKKRKNCSLKVK